MLSTTLKSILKANATVGKMAADVGVGGINNNFVSNIIHNNSTEHDLVLLYRNISKTLSQLQKMRQKGFSDRETSEAFYDDNSNAW